MIQSMTAFARSEIDTDQGHLICDIRSVNHRYLEVGLRLSEMLSPFEMALRDLIRKRIKRGKVDCVVRFEPKEVALSESVALNEALAKKMCAFAERINTWLPASAPLSAGEILCLPQVLQTKTGDVTALKETVLQVFEKTLSDFLAVARREGEAIHQVFLVRMASMKKELSVIQERLPLMLKSARENLLARFEAASVTLEANRLEQEMVLFAERMDVAEEVDRLQIHLNEMTRILQSDDLMGRRLDFLLQELNREANTLASKSQDTTLTYAALQLKVLIEQIREQVQNIA